MVLLSREYIARTRSARCADLGKSLTVMLGYLGIGYRVLCLVERKEINVKRDNKDGRIKFDTEDFEFPEPEEVSGSREI
jgi:hypothetical protein